MAHHLTEACTFSDKVVNVFSRVSWTGTSTSDTETLDSTQQRVVAGNKGTVVSTLVVERGAKAPRRRRPTLISPLRTSLRGCKACLEHLVCRQIARRETSAGSYALCLESIAMQGTQDRYVEQSKQIAPSRRSKNGQHLDLGSSHSTAWPLGHHWRSKASRSPFDCRPL